MYGFFFFFSPMQNINQKHHIGEAWERKKQDGMDLLLFAIQCYWDQIERGMFFLHEHPATASSWGLTALQELEAYPGVHVVTADMCRWGMRVKPLWLKMATVGGVSFGKGLLPYAPLLC